MPRSKPTLIQKQKKLQDNGLAHPDAYLDTNIKNRYVDAARILELNGSWPESLAIRIFGPQLMGSLAFALDNLAKFKNSFRTISLPTRRVFRGLHRVDTHSYVSQRTVHTRNYEIFEDDPPVLVPEFFVDETTSDFVYDPLVDVGFPDYYGEVRIPQAEEYQADSTQKQRFKGQTAGTREALQKISGNWLQVVYTLIGTDVDYTISNAYGLGDVLFDRYVTTTVVNQVGANSIPAEWIYFDNREMATLNSQAEELANKHLQDFVPKCLANRRFFQGAYQIGELRDLPKLVRSVDDLLRFFRQTVLSPLRTIPVLDKRLGNLYLGWKFGYESLRDAIKDVWSSPERIAKHFNYLLSRNNKVSTGKFAKTFKYVNESPEGINFDPTPLSYTPFGGTIVSQSDYFELEYDAKCVVNQTLAFPPLMVPKFSDKNYRDLWGLNPQLVDLYNLVPFTWLLDWYTGAGSYLNMIRQCTDDRFLINYGFMTINMRPKHVSSQVVKVSDTLTVRHADGSVDVTESNIRLLPFVNEYTYVFSKRMDIASLSGEIKSASELENLTDSQLKILGALLTKFS